MSEGGGGTIGFDFTSSVAESFYFTEYYWMDTTGVHPTVPGGTGTINFDYTSSLTDSIYLLDSITKSVSTTLQPDEVFLSESSYIQRIIVSSDEFNVDETTLLEISRVFRYPDASWEEEIMYVDEAYSSSIEAASVPESVGLDEYFSKVPPVVLSDDLLFNESMALDLRISSSGGTGTINFDYTESSIDSILLAESLLLSPRPFFGEWVSLVESAQHRISTATGEAISIEESFGVWFAGQLFGDSVFFSEATQFGITQVKGENLFLVEGISKISTPASFIENLSILEGFSNRSIRSNAENLYLVEAESLKVKPRMPENIWLAELDSYRISTVRGELVYLGEQSGLRTSLKPLGENIYLAEIFDILRSAFGNFMESITWAESSTNALSTYGADVFNVSETATLRTFETTTDAAVIYDSFFYMAWWPAEGKIQLSPVELVASETYYAEHFAETISWIERPSLLEVTRPPVITKVNSNRPVFQVSSLPKMVSIDGDD